MYVSQSHLLHMSVACVSAAINALAISALNASLSLGEDWLPQMFFPQAQKHLLSIYILQFHKGH